ncbi:small ribosomal subunit protein mS37 [Genypterus blacodes]|uniref:small ribosomal subunit protein mS37 n=1 Tax=Genypterus blacodes TaxID=154954 RepID=UPI003F75A5CE
MAAQGGTAYLEKVRKLLSRERGKPVLKPKRPLVLKDNVANRKPQKEAAPCVTEMTVMMACWKQNNFVEALCSNELGAFFSCVENAQAEKRNKSNQTSGQGGKLTPKQATTLLKRFPTLRNEI